MAEKRVTQDVPANIRRTCAEWAKKANKPTMEIVAKGKNGFYMADLLMETVSCLIGYILLPKQEEALRKVEQWVLSQANEWTLASDRGDQLDRSKGLENG